MTIIDARPFIAIGIAFLAALLVSMSNKYPNIRETWSAVGSITMFGVIISMVNGVLNGVTYEYTLFNLTDTIGPRRNADRLFRGFCTLHRCDDGHRDGVELVDIFRVL